MRHKFSESNFTLESDLSDVTKHQRAQLTHISCNVSPISQYVSSSPESALVVFESSA